MENPSWMGEKSRSQLLLAILLIVAAPLPLLFAAIPPLTDLPGHIAQYKVAADLGSSPFLGRYYDFHWSIVGNLGVDLLVHPLAHLMGVEGAARLVVAVIPPLTVGGMLLLASEIHGRIPATAGFALPLAYAFPFQFGFVNFALAIAFFYLGLGLWLRLGRLGLIWLRALIFALFSFILFIAHSVAWGMFGLVIFTVEFVTARNSGASVVGASQRAFQLCLPLAPPVMLLTDWMLNRSDGQLGDWSLSNKIYNLFTVLRNGHERFDLLGAVILYSVLLLGARRIGLRFEKRLGWAALILFGAYWAMPGLMMGAYHADMRMMAYILALAVLAIYPTFESRLGLYMLAAAALVFFTARLAVQSWTYAQLDTSYQAELQALDHVPMGARIFAMVKSPCPTEWEQPRIWHLPAMATVRRDAFVNDQWPMPGGRLLSVIYKPAAGFALDPSQMLLPRTCPLQGGYTLKEAIAKFPRRAFDFVWLIGVPADQWPHDSGLAPVWSNSGSILYRIAR